MYALRKYRMNALCNSLVLISKEASRWMLIYRLTKLFKKPQICLHSFVAQKTCSKWYSLSVSIHTNKDGKGHLVSVELVSRVENNNIAIQRICISCVAQYPEEMF